MKLLKWILVLLVIGASARLFVNTYSSAGAPVASDTHYGQLQSPIDLNDAYSVDLRDIEFHYNTNKFSIVNTGYFIRLDPRKEGQETSFIVVDGQEYKLIEFHFHTPSEHLVEGKSYSMEAHFVHTNQNGDIAVVGVLFEQGAHNKEFEKIIRNLPETVKVNHNIDTPIALHLLFPKDKRTYRYSGSLTTPAYLEGVKWSVMKQPVQLSDVQITKMKTLMGENNRALQPRNERPVFLACC